MSHEPISIEALVGAPLDKVWELYNKAEHVVHWNNASPDWHTPRAENDLRPGGRFNYRMESRDGKEGFDFAGEYIDVVPNEKVAYVMGDGRKAEVLFHPDELGTRVVVTFDPESENTREVQESGWRAILENFKSYAEGSA